MLPDHFIKELVKRKDLHPQAADMIEKHADDEARDQLITNSATPHHVLERMAEQQEGRGDSHVVTLNNIHLNPNAPASLLHKAIEHPRVYIGSKFGTVGHENTDPDVTHDFVEKHVFRGSRFSFGLHRIAEKKNIHPRTIDLLYSKLFGNSRHPNENETVAMSGLRSTIAHNPNTSNETLRSIKNWVRQIKPDHDYVRPVHVDQIRKALSARGIT